VANACNVSLSEGGTHDVQNPVKEGHNGPFFCFYYFNKLLFYFEKLIFTCKNPIRKRITMTAIKLIEETKGIPIVKIENAKIQMPITILDPNLNASQAPNICVEA
jgi:hypothetical protein